MPPRTLHKKHSLEGGPPASARLHGGGWIGQTLRLVSSKYDTVILDHFAIPAGRGIARRLGGWIGNFRLGQGYSVLADAPWTAVCQITSNLFIVRSLRFSGDSVWRLGRCSGPAQ